MLLAFVGGPRTGHEAISLGMYLIASAIIVTYAGARLPLTRKR